ncbi:type IV pilus twitching motility protein PilT [Acaryochloris marina]|uniref:Type IV pili twitching motility protein PilT n=1 Tax=Acaryochloris marina (strain MBIC 11017) TaxID=329726 RepID=B0CDP7_ACAM1|nr:type IV pilus twitching motility protein PilT [Acaryochloris marina]ABW28116.1 type IV pili twitching motility protein PilT [Acaryochloris marina MBIC11017]
MTDYQRPPFPPPPAPLPAVPPPPHRDQRSEGDAMETEMIATPTKVVPTKVVSAPPPQAAEEPTAFPQTQPYAGYGQTEVDNGEPTQSTLQMRGRPPGTGVTLEQLVREAFENNFSDIHLGVGEVPRFRDRGRLEMSRHPVTDDTTFEYWLEEILTPEEIQRFHAEQEYDGATQYDGMARVRINIFVSLKGPSMVMRLIPLKILTLEDLNLPLVFQDLCHYHKGLILVTGPTGSGKSTTMAAMVDYINTEMPKHIISIEDPIEFVHQSRKAMIRQREVGIHTKKFDNALKASLREDPDVILIGEMRDRETVNTALKAAQTGHLVFGTLHTNSAVKTIERILNLYKPEEQEPMRVQVAESLVAVIAQSLVRTTDGKRAAIHEIMINTDAIKDYILRGDVEEVEAMIPQCSYDGMITMNQCLHNLYEEGRIDEETALEMSPKPNEMAQILRGRI